MKINKVSIVTPEFPPFSGGCSRSTEFLASQLTSTGKEVRVIVVNSNYTLEKKETPYNIKIISGNPRKLLYFLYIIFNIRKYTKDYSIIHVYNVFLIPFVQLANIGRKIRIYATLNNYNWGCLNPIYYAHEKCSTCNFASRIKCSSLLRNIIFSIVQTNLNKIKKYFVFSGAMAKIYSLSGMNLNFSRIQNFKPKKIQSSQKLKKSGKVNIAYIGSQDSRKGYDLFISLSKKLHRKANFYVCSIDYSIEEQTTYPFIKFLSFNTKNQLSYEKFYSNLDILVHPCRWNEPFARVWMEAASYKSAIITSDNQSHVEILSDNVIYFNNGSLNDLISKVSILLSNRDLLTTFQTKAFEWYENLIDNDEIVSDIQKSYEH